MSLNFLLLPFFSEKMSHYFATMLGRGWMEQIRSWITNLFFISSVRQAWVVPCVIFLWIPVFSDKSSRLDWSNGHAILTFLSDTKTSCCCAECCFFALSLSPDRHVDVKSMLLFMMVRQLHVFEKDLLMQTSNSPNYECMCFHFHINQLDSAPYLNEWLIFIYLFCGCKRDEDAYVQKSFGCPMGQSRCSVTCICSGWEWGLPSVFLCHLEDHVVSELTLRVTETLIS